MEEEPSSDADVRGFMRQKYYEQKWLDHDKLRSHTERVRKLYQSLFDEEGLRRPGAKDPPVPGMPTTTPSRPASLQLSQSAWLPKPPASPAATTTTFQTPPPSSPVPTSASSPTKFAPRPPLSAPPLEAQFKDLLSLDEEAAPQPTSNHAARAPSTPTPAPPPSVPTSPHNNTSSNRNSTNSIFAELAGLEPSRRATYSGGILTPTTPNQPSSSHTLFSKPIPAAQPSPPKSSEPDPYAALRNLPKAAASPPPAQFSYDADFDDEPFSDRRGSDEFSWTEFSASTSTTTDSLAQQQQQQQQHQKPIGAELFSDLDPIAQMKRSRA
ncbi:hypothetical protein BCR43DRAFT_494992 [Syncephalastrum racemosum]|uniref:Uncharacterized protein n=1 Tax=Syncephalastrum racemosum TaxID=13706 RepID=A0A1X2H8Z1_SYNRA|nr:hypothetical protein BCR43DRAFT_494992 [Syncephalastrum racemosum]